MNNQGKFVETLIRADELAKVTGNCYMVLSTRPYEGKDDIPNGITLNLLIEHDNAPEGFYGVKKDGSPREGVLYQNITVTVCNGRKDEDMKAIHAGDHVALYDFDADHSYYINYDLILRYKNFKKVGNSDNEAKDR